MATVAQVDANRLNAQHSTGPRTDVGKAAASQNAYRHGLRSASPVGPGEDPAAYQAFAMEVIAELRPVGISQHLQAERIAQLQWKLLRIPAIEAQMLEQARVRLQNAARKQGSLRKDFPTPTLIATDLDTMMKLQTYESRLSRGLDQARKQLLQMQQAAKEAAQPAAQSEPEKQTPAAATAPVQNVVPELGLQQNWVRSAPIAEAPSAMPEPPALSACSATAGPVDVLPNDVAR